MARLSSSENKPKRKRKNSKNVVRDEHFKLPKDECLHVLFVIKYKVMIYIYII